MKKEFDVFVIGSGVAGRYVASQCAKAGFRVAISDKREFGGTCANRGCIPKKVVLGPTEVLEMAQNLKGKGIASIPKLNWKKNQKFKKQFTDNVPAGTEEKLKDLGVTLYHQSPKFLDESTLKVEGKTVTADKIVIATGYVPRTLNIKNANYLRVSDDFLSLKALPKSVIFIGAGYVGLELAHMAVRYGCKVTIIEKNKDILKNFDSDLVAKLLEHSKRIGIKIIFNAEVVSVEKLRKNYRIHYSVNGENKNAKARMVFNTSGRVPAISQLDLEKGNISYNSKGVEVNNYMQNPTNPRVYACGDVSSHSLPLSPLSGLEAKVVANNIINESQQEIKVTTVPSAVFTLPNLASVGLSERTANKKYKNVKVNYGAVPDWYNSKRINTNIYAYKILINKRTDQIVGAHLLGPHAAETINLFAIAIHQQLTVKSLKQMVLVFPTWAYDIKNMLS